MALVVMYNDLTSNDTMLNHYKSRRLTHGLAD